MVPAKIIVSVSAPAIAAIALQVPILLALLVACLMSARRRCSWHAFCRIGGVALYLLALAGTILAIADELPPYWGAVFLCTGLLAGTLLSVGYFGQVLESRAQAGGKEGAK
jgi:hypothetical protein